MSETSVETQKETCIRKETSFCYYEVVQGSDSWWECLFFTVNWGDFHTALKRYTGKSFTSYKKDPEETNKNWSTRLKDLEIILFENYGVSAVIEPKSYRMTIIDRSNVVRPAYAIKQKPKSKVKN